MQTQSARCFVLGPIRGDTFLFRTLISEVCQVAQPTYRVTPKATEWHTQHHPCQWQWTATHTTVIILGNLLGAFDPAFDPGIAYRDLDRVPEQTRKAQEAKYWFRQSLLSYGAILSDIQILTQQAAQAEACHVLFLAGPLEAALMGEVAPETLDPWLFPTMETQEYVAEDQKTLAPERVVYADSTMRTQWHTFLTRHYHPFLRTHSSALIIWARYILSYGWLLPTWIQHLPKPPTHTFPPTIEWINHCWLQACHDYGTTQSTYSRFFLQENSPTQNNFGERSLDRFMTLDLVSLADTLQTPYDMNYVSACLPPSAFVAHGVEVTPQGSIPTTLPTDKHIIMVGAPCHRDELDQPRLFHAGSEAAKVFEQQVTGQLCQPTALVLQLHTTPPLPNHENPILLYHEPELLLRSRQP